MSTNPQITNTRTVARSRLFRIEEVGLRFSNGTEVKYERLRGSERGAVLVVPVLDGRTLLLIREYCAGSGRYELAFPKGRIEDGETPEVAAGREIKEEVGYGARRIRHLRGVTLAPGYFGHTTELLLAEDLYPERLEGDEPEPIEVVPWAMADVPALLAREDFTEARSIAALYIVRDILAAGAE
jgi:ADP-ribose diphosphatase